MTPVRPLALVTGASSGIGAAFAEHYAADGHDLIVVARRGERLEDLAGKCADAHATSTEIVVADLATAHGRRLTREAVDRNRTLSVAVLNAGIGAVGPLASSDRTRQVEMVDLNCGSTTDLVCHVVPGMIEAGRGDIIIVSSAAGWQPIPHTATYAATKSFGLFLAEALHNELRGTGVRVIASCPGPTSTEFGLQAGSSGHSRWIPYESVDGVVSATVRGLTAGRPRVTTGWLARASTLAASILPRRVSVAAAGAIHRRLGRADQ